MDRVTIIGGTGFIGDYLTGQLSKNQNINISIISRSEQPSSSKQIQHIKLDASRNSEQLRKVLSATDYLVVLSRPNKKIIENITKPGLSFKKMIYASTILIYPNSRLKQNENSPLQAANDYEQEKINEEAKLGKFAVESGNKLVIARLTNVYGDVKNRALIHWIVSSLVKKQEFTLNNEGRPVRDFIFVEDVATFIELLIFLPQEELIEVFNLCTGEGFSINQVIKEIELISGQKLKIKPGVKTPEKETVIGDNKKVITATGFKLRYNLKKGLEKTYQNYLQKCI